MKPARKTAARKCTCLLYTSLTVGHGEIVGLLGPHGAGKTTSFYMVAGLVRPDEGRVIFAGENITELPMNLGARRGMGYLPQELSLIHI